MPLDISIWGMSLLLSMAELCIHELSNRPCVHVPSEGKQEAKALMEERSAIPRSSFIVLPKSECQTAKSERHTCVWDLNTDNTQHLSTNVRLARFGFSTVWEQNTQLYMYVWTTGISQKQHTDVTREQDCQRFPSLSQTIRSWIPLKWMVYTGWTSGPWNNIFFL